MAYIAFLGTGLLGSAMVERFLAASTAVTVWNRTASKADALRAFGATVAATPADAVAGARFVHLVLRDGDAVRDVVHAAGDVLRESIVIDHTTISPADATALMRELSELGIRYLHAPVFMGPSGARAAGGSMYVSGTNATWELVREHLRPMSAAVHYLGERADKAAVLKLVGNAMIIGITATLVDALTMATAADVTPEDAMSLFTHFNPCGTIGGRGTAMANGDYRASFELRMARKDVQLMLDTAARAEVPLCVLPAVAARMDALLVREYGDRDFAVMAIDTVPERTI